MKPGDTKQVPIEFKVEYLIKAAGIGHFQVTATCEFGGETFKGEASAGGGQLPTLMGRALAELLQQMHQRYWQFLGLPPGVMLKPEAELLKIALLDLFSSPQAPLSLGDMPRQLGAKVSASVSQAQITCSQCGSRTAIAQCEEGRIVAIDCPKCGHLVDEDYNEEEPELLPPSRRR